MTADVERQHWHLLVMNQVFGFNLSMYPLAELTQHKAKGKFDNDFIELIDVDYKTGLFSLQSV